MRYVIYCRVSTKKQGDSGLSLDAQKRDIAIFLGSYADKLHEIIGVYTDMESGTNNERPELNAAIALAKKSKATLLVSKLDRLSRKVSFISKLMEDTKLNIQIASMPNADKFQLHIYAALAEQEREFISARTKAALAEVKVRRLEQGLPPLGGLRDKTNQRNIAKKKLADRNAKKLATLINPMIRQQMSLRDIAESLNQAGVTTSTGCQFSATTVKRIIDRI